MVSLLKRDFLISLPYFITVIIIFPFVYFTGTLNVFLYYWCMISLVIGLYYYDKQSEMNRYLVSLPLSRKQIIFARYLFILIVAIALFLFLIIIDLFFHNVYYQWFPYIFPINEPMYAPSFLLHLCGVLIIIGLSIPLYVKLPYFVALTINLLSIVFVPITIIYANFQFAKYNVEWFFIVTGFLLNLFLSQPAIVTILLTVMIFFSSFQISKWIFIKKDL